MDSEKVIINEASEISDEILVQRIKARFVHVSHYLDRINHYMIKIGSETSYLIVHLHCYDVNKSLLDSVTYVNRFVTTFAKATIMPLDYQTIRVTFVIDNKFYEE